MRTPKKSVKKAAPAAAPVDRKAQRKKARIVRAIDKLVKTADKSHGAMDSAIRAKSGSDRQQRAWDRAAEFNAKIGDLRAELVALLD